MRSSRASLVLFVLLVLSLPLLLSSCSGHPTPPPQRDGGEADGARADAGGPLARPWVAFVSNQTGHFSLYLIHDDGSDLRLLVEGGENLSPAWSPDGKRLAFSSNRGGGQYGLYLAEVETGAVAPLPTGLPVASAPAWSPDGTRIAFAALDGIYLVSAAGGAAMALAPGGEQDNSPGWSPSGAEIYFSSKRSGTFEVWSVRPDGSALAKVTEGARPLGGPVATRDGQALLYAKGMSSSGFGSSSGIVSFSLSTKTETVLTSTGEFEPAVSASGTRMVVSSTRFGASNPELVLLDLPGATNPVRLTDSPGVDGQAAFQPAY